MQYPSMVRSKVFAIGMHWKIVAVTDATQYTATLVSTMALTNLNHRTFPNILIYSRRIDALVRFMLNLYVIWQR